MDRHVASLADPLEGDGSPSQIVIMSAFGSTARPKECTNIILGPGIYRRYVNGTCVGIPLFSKRAGKVESPCTDQMWEGLNASSISASLILETVYYACVGSHPPSTLSHPAPTVTHPAPTVSHPAPTVTHPPPNPNHRKKDNSKR